MYANDREIVTLSRGQDNIFRYHFGNDGFDTLGDPDLYDYGLGKSKLQKFLKRASGNDPVLLRPFSKDAKRKVAHTVTGAVSGCVTGFFTGGGPIGCVVGAVAGAVAGAGTPWSKNKDRWQGKIRYTGRTALTTAGRGAVAGAVAGGIYGAYAGTGIGGAAKGAVSTWWTGGTGAATAGGAATSTAVTTGAGTAAASSAGILGTGITWGQVGTGVMAIAPMLMARGQQAPGGCPTGYVQVAEGCLPQDMAGGYQGDAAAMAGGGEDCFGVQCPPGASCDGCMDANCRRIPGTAECGGRNNPGCRPSHCTGGTTLPEVMPADPMTGTPAGTTQQATYAGGGGGPASEMHAGNPDYLPSDYELAQMAMREEEARRRALEEKPNYILWIAGGIALAGGAYYLYTRKKTRKPLSGRA